MVEALTKRDLYQDPSRISVDDDSVQPRGEHRAVDRFAYHLTEAMTFLDNFDPYAPNPLAALNQKIERFLGKYAGLSYRELLRQAHPERFQEEDYALLPKNGLRRKLFDYRASIYLAAFDSCEQEGFSVSELVEVVRKARLFPIKKSEQEPTLEKIIGFLNK